MCWRVTGDFCFKQNVQQCGPSISKETVVSWSRQAGLLHSRLKILNSIYIYASKRRTVTALSVRGSAVLGENTR